MQILLLTENIEANTEVNRNQAIGKNQDKDQDRDQAQEQNQDQTQTITSSQMQNYLQKDPSITLLRYLAYKTSQRNLQIITNIDLAKTDKHRLYMSKFKNSVKVMQFLNDTPYTKSELVLLKKTLTQVDAVIINCCSANFDENFRLGFQAALAIEAQKPILIFTSTDVKSFTKALGSSSTTIVNYDRYKLPSIITEFLQKVANKGLTTKINLFITKDQQNTIQQKAKLLNTSQAAVIRRLIDDSKLN